MKVKIILENGMEFNGKSFGYVSDTSGEIVINTDMFNYQSIITDPSYCNQILVMTYPSIGNCGIDLDKCESESPFLNALIVNEYDKKPTHIKCELDLDSYLKTNKIVGIYNVDTRELTRVLREHGSMNAKIKILNNETISKNNEFFTDKVTAIDLMKKVSTKKEYVYSQGIEKIAVLDFGVKISTLNFLKEKNYNVKVFPYNTSYENIKEYNPDLVILSSGPGNPEDLLFLKDTIIKLCNTFPIIAVSLGHQLLSICTDGKIKKYKLGNRGSNYPVINTKNKKIYITNQNTSYFVSEAPNNFDVMFENVNNKSIQGLKHKDKPIISLQFDIFSDEFKFIFEEII